MQCLVAAVRPLRVEELAEVLAFDFNTEGILKLNLGWRWKDQEEAVMSACSSWVIIVKDGDSRVVQFSRFSVKEFLTADRFAERIRDISHYHIRLDAAHTILVQACLSVLLRLDDRVDRDGMKSFPLARYAAPYWATHALYYAAMLEFRDLAEHLITKHPEYECAWGGDEVTPLHVAASAGHSDILSLLIEHGADINGPGKFGSTPLHRASLYTRLEAGQFLLSRGADIDARDDYTYTILMYASTWGHAEFVRMLLEHGAMTDVQDNLGKTALYWAVFHGRTEVVRLLLEHGADAHVRDQDGKTPSELGSQMGHHEIVELLSDCDASSVKK